jgi:hypothetical protein
VNGKMFIEARYRFDVLTEPEVSNDPGNSDSLPTVPEELMHLFQSEIYESDDSDMPIVSVLPDLPDMQNWLSKLFSSLAGMLCISLFSFFVCKNCISVRRSDVVFFNVPLFS